MTQATATQTIATDALVVGVTPARGNRKGVVVHETSGLTVAARRKLEGALHSVGATGSVLEVTKVPGTGIAKADVVLAIGLGSEQSSLEVLRRAAGTAARTLSGTRRATFALGDRTPEQIEAVALGAALGAYAFTAHKGAGTKSATSPLKSISVLVTDAKSKDVLSALERANILSAAVNASRDLVNTPPSALAPADLAEAARTAGAAHGIKVKVWSEKQLAQEGFGGITAVGMGSVNPPRLVRMEYRHPEATRHLALVGKGITFDTGGISLKPPAAMETMKSDMSGAAAVLQSVIAIARLGLPIDVTGWLACAENMPSGTAQRPSDVITIYGGRTVEVMNTDAEGRLVLADAIVKAAEEKPDLIVDVATLTGAQGVALGTRTSGVMGNTDAGRDGVTASANAAGEAMWPMPIPEEIRATLDSMVADLSNMGEPFGGMLTGAAFLREFVPSGQVWVHLDIARPAFNSGGPYGYTPKGATGHAVRTLVQVAADLSEGRLL